MESSERTPLRSSVQGSSYVFTTNPSRMYRKSIRKCQCFVCAALLCTMVLTMVIAVSWMVNHSSGDDSPSTLAPENQTSSAPSSAMNKLLTMTWPLPSGTTTSKWSDEPSGAEVEAAIDAGKERLKVKDALEMHNIPLAVDTPSYRHQKAVGTGEEASRLARVGYIMDLATREIVKGIRKRNATWTPIGRGVEVKADWLPVRMCADEPLTVDYCTKTPYRSADGLCNNPNHPWRWGVAMRPFRRMLPPDYADGVSSPRVGTNGAPLPSARKVSVLVHRPMYRDDPEFTVMLAVWGQFMDHDITATALSKGANMSAISCCYDIDNPENLHPECYPVRLGDGDPYYDQYNVSCMEFVRSAPAPACSLGPREQLNQATTYLDGSVIYGSSDELMRELRSLQGGQLKTTLTADGRSLLPFNEDPKDGCNQEVESKKGRYCFASGDSRANENIHLTTMHLLLVRQHNLVARQLASLNPTWDDERIFQETRRIVSAQMQHITYHEFLPVLLGRLLMETMNIFPKSTGFYEGYNASVDATVANEFAAAAFRFSHTLLPGLIRMLSNDNSSDEYVELHSMLFNPFELYKIGGMDNTIRGAMSTNTQKVDPYFTNQITQKLFQGHAPCGLDLVTLNIQRGRDHGLPGYPAWRKLCGLSVPKTFGDLKGVIDDGIIQKMSTLYRSVDDIDMYTGALSEFPVKDGFLGPTVACLLSDQFYRLKVGDRFWYENFQEPQAFTPEQLHEIRKTTLAGLICANSDSVTSAQPWVMRTKKPGNYLVPCYGSSIHHPDLTLWEEKEGAFVRPGIGRIKLGPFNSVRAIKQKNSVTPSPNSTEADGESKRWKEERVRWQEDTAKWMAQVDKVQNHKG